MTSKDHVGNSLEAIGFNIHLVFHIILQFSVDMIFLAFIHQCSLEDPTTVPVSKQIVVDWDPNPKHDG